MIIGRALLSLLVLLAIAYGLSEKRNRIKWSLPLYGFLLQVILAILLLRVPYFREGMEGLSRFFLKIVDFSKEGAYMIFGELPDDPQRWGIAFIVLPTIIFFSAFSAVLYHLRILQWFVFVFAWMLSKTLRLSGAECLAAAANVFVGQTEAPLVVKPYLKGMTPSEVMALMTGGMATIAGGVLVIYMSLLGGGDEEQVVFFGKHLLTASALSAPAALVMAKMMSPQTETVDVSLSFPRRLGSESLLDAATRGTTDGIKLALNVGGMLIAFTALVKLANWLVAGAVGSWTGLNGWVAELTGGQFAEFNLSFVLGVASAPFAFLLGVPAEDLLLVGQLLGERLVLNEFIAYLTFNDLKQAGLLEDPTTILICTYALCGFANLTSVGIQVGGISALEPAQRRNLLKYGMRSMLAGMLACYMTAIIVSAIFQL